MNALKLDEETIYHVARRIADPEARAAYLDQVCASDSAVRGRVEGLLRVCGQEASFLEVPPFDATVDAPFQIERGMGIGSGGWG